MLVERSTLVRSGLRRVLEEGDIAVIAEAADVPEAIEALASHTVDVVVICTAVDRDACRASAIASLRRAADLGIVCVRRWADTRDVDAALSAGALACVEMSDALEADLRNAVRLVSQSECYVSPGLQAAPPINGSSVRSRLRTPHRARARSARAHRSQPVQSRNRARAPPERQHRRRSPQSHHEEGRRPKSDRAGALCSRARSPAPAVIRSLHGHDLDVPFAAQDGHAGVVGMPFEPDVDARVANSEVRQAKPVECFREPAARERYSPAGRIDLYAKRRGTATGTPHQPPMLAARTRPDTTSGTRGRDAGSRRSTRAADGDRPPRSDRPWP